MTEIALQNSFIGIEFGSTRIKAVLIDSEHQPAAQGSYEWENQLENGIWTYALDEIHHGLQACFKALAADVEAKFGQKLTKVGGIGISAMMHGYLAFDKAGKLLVPFRTWRNNITGEAASQLTEAFNFNIPERWSIAHLWQAELNHEPHVKDVAFFTTLAGYIHWQLTGEKVLGVGDASGMFPIDSQTGDYDADMLKIFDVLAADSNLSHPLRDLLPKVLSAGENAGTLTAAGALLLDPSGTLQAGIPCCPPEGDAGTGMVATGAVAARTGNVSAGTSIFAMIVLEHALTKLHREIDMVTTPDGLPVAMVHANNCTSDLNAWVGLFGQFAKQAGLNLSPNDLFGLLYNAALKGDPDCGGLMSYCYLSGEFITGLTEGRPLFMRKPNANFSLENFMRTHLFSALGALKIGMDILMQEEHVGLDRLMGHGGLFKTKLVGQKIMAAAMNAPISVLTTAGEGGAWGIAILAAYARKHEPNETLADYLAKHVLAKAQGLTIEPDPKDVQGFNQFMQAYTKALPVEKQAAADF